MLRTVPGRSSRPMQIETLEDRLTPTAFNIQGTILYVAGTAGADTFRFTQGPTSFQVNLNNEELTVPSSTVSAVVVDGGGGQDSAEVTGGSGADTFVAEPGSASLIGPGYLVGLTGFKSVVAYGQANDYAILKDSPGNDSYIGSSIQSVLTNNSTYTSVANSFGSVDVIASAGVDYAVLKDSAGNDTLLGMPGYVNLTGPGYGLAAVGFDSVDSTSLYGGTDVAYLFDSGGDDTYLYQPGYANMNASGGFGYAAVGFGETFVFFSTGNDTSYLFGTPANDTLNANPAELEWDTDGGTTHVQNADTVLVDATQGGQDKANLGDSFGNDKFLGSGNSASLESAASTLTATGFDVVTLTGAGGDNKLELTNPLDYYFGEKSFVD